MRKLVPKQLQNHSLSFIHKNKSLLSATSILSRSLMAYNTTASLDKLTCTDYVEFCKSQPDLDNFLGPKMIPTTWMLNSNYSRKMTTKSSDWSKILQWQRQIATYLCGWGISWSWQFKTLLEEKVWPQWWYLQCPKTRMNNSNWLTRWLT